ncbi:hypothetical protein SpCBS45565_g04470 [Spizellomyces sp. 'palustris']|nr:hypothetical protein SpCBS45565_g04470 [Spizellomyces sp. 'palustris']
MQLLLRVVQRHSSIRLLGPLSWKAVLGVPISRASQPQRQWSTSCPSYSARTSSDRFGRRTIPRPPIRRPTHEPASAVEPDPSQGALQTTVENTVPVHLPERDPEGAVLTKASGAYSVLAHPALMVTRQIEMMNVLIGYEQANKYAIKNANGQDVGFIAEEETSFSGVLARQFLRTRRPFKAVVLDQSGNVVLKVSRPLKWFLNSTILIHDAHDNLIGEVTQVWHLWRRKYDLFWKRRQFAQIDAGFWAWDFHILDESAIRIGEVNRNFVGFAREIFTDTGTYAIHMDDVERVDRPLSLDERAVMLFCAVNIDIDYFSRHSSHGGGFMPIPFFGGMGETEDTRSGVPAPTAGGDVTPSVGAGGGGPGVFVPFGMMGGMGGNEGAAGQAPQGGVSGQTPPTPPPADSQTNQWGESPFVSDDEAGVGSGAGGFFDGFFDDD